MNRFFRFVRRTSIVSIVVALVSLAMVSATQAESPNPLDKHARKIEKRLAKFQSGTYLEFELRDSSQIYGSLGSLSSSSFQFTNADSNKVETYSYDELERVKKGKEYIGSGSEPGRHVRLLVPIVIGACAAAAALAVVEVVH